MTQTTFARRAVILLGLGLTLASPALAQEESAHAVLRRLDDLYRGESSVSTLRVEVTSARFERVMEMRSWTEGEDRTLVRVLEPEKERGLTTLKVENDIYNYLPKVDRTLKVPASMMSSSWMGTHLSNDDLLGESRLSEDYRCEFERRARENDGVHVIACTPRPDAPVVWGKVVVRVRAEENLPLDERFYDERGELVRTLEYGDVRTMDGRRIPTRVTVLPADKPNERTVFIVKDIRFDVDIDDELFEVKARGG